MIIVVTDEKLFVLVSAVYLTECIEAINGSHKMYEVADFFSVSPGLEVDFVGKDLIYGEAFVPVAT